jgi:hypothetical protein
MLALRQQQRRGGVAKGMERDGGQSSAAQEWTVHVGEEVAGLHGSSESVGEYQPEIVPEAAGRLTLPFLTRSMTQESCHLWAALGPRKTEATDNCEWWRSADCPGQQPFPSVPPGCPMTRIVSRTEEVA